MNDEDLIDWHDVIEAVANGKLTGHRCPACGTGVLQTSSDGVSVQARCPECGQGFGGKLAYGRDDGLYAEADRILAAQAAARSPGQISSPIPSPEPTGTADVAAVEDYDNKAVSGRVVPEVTPERGPWEWQLPAGSADPDGYVIWAEIVEAIYNGRRSGLKCPLCSEPLEDITVRRPYLRAKCGVCGEGFEGKVG